MTLDPTISHPDGDLVDVRPEGLAGPGGVFFVDPWRPVEHAIITHAHADHARPGSRHYLTTSDGAGVLRTRLGADASIQTVAYGEPLRLGDATVSLHPAGHVLGSAQVRIDVGGRVAVVSGDYKRHADPTCVPFEPVPCDVFVSECTFGLPIYRWPDPAAVFADINAWWRRCQDDGRTAVIFVYAFGKAQRLLAGADASIGPILVHGAIDRLLPAYHAAGVELPETSRADHENAKRARGRALVLAPPSARGSTWIRKFGPVATAMASGWMRVRGQRRRRSVDRGFVLSDHADWPGLEATIAETGATRVLLTHGATEPMTRWLRERGVDAGVLPTPYEGEMEESNEPPPDRADGRTDGQAEAG
ncbi:MAG: ligase-associated DNA damage response exonuclease [Phycisphaerales bacterium]|nr:ligase-associated DNA damage response exonuclease [Phycisphaerae bacterium]NNF41449.1 ligase-associated DNA damage response exonuclease [Phycisphaerales bacterium]NNM26551.1 ligase-associated DNA damage response exonuclease [Phycisphaerales bacterium]